MSRTNGFCADHEALLRQIADDAAETASWTGRALFSPPVMDAMRWVPRHAFVAEADQRYSYDNRPLAIGFGQTISQPYIVAVMTELLDLDPEDRVLEVGTGSGYQTAVLARLARMVYSLEVVPELAVVARHRLAELGYTNVAVREGDGFEGWPKQAPFQAIIVTAAPMAIPPALVEQLAAGGRLVVPVGPAGDTQMLYRCCKRTDGSLQTERKLPVAFVPMVPG
jgi:protein-L-isoaspartate(D-aspartate) O-methyltransferase